MHRKKLIFSGIILITTLMGVLMYVLFTTFGIINGESTKKQLTIKTESAQKIYDGTPLTSELFTLFEGELGKEERIEPKEYTKITNVGKADNIIQFVILNKNNSDVTKKYEINYLFGKLEVIPKTIYIETKEESKIYDGEELTSDEYILDEKALIKGDAVKVIGTTKITDVGTKLNEIVTTILNHQNIDVTKNYDIKYKNNNLTIKKIPITIASRGKSKVYDGEELTGSDDDIIPIQGLLEGHQVENQFTGTITEPGSAENQFVTTIKDNNGKDVTAQYDIKYGFGNLTVLTSIYSDGKIENKNVEEYENTIVASIETDHNGSTYLRYKSFGDFFEGSWQDNNIQTDSISPLLFTSLSIEKNSKAIKRQTMNLVYEKDQVPFLAPYYISSQIKDELNITNDSYIKNTKLDSYKFVFTAYNTLVNGASNIIEEYSAEEAQYYENIKAYYLSIPEEIKPILDKLIQNIKITPTELGDKKELVSVVKKVSKYFKENFNQSNKSDYAKSTLKEVFETNEGSADQLATLATLLLRRLDIPARYTTGYYTDIRNNLGSLHEENAHSWVEFYIQNMGWIPLEVTPGIADKIEITVTPNKVTKQWDGNDLEFDPKNIRVTNFQEYKNLGYTYEAIINKMKKPETGKYKYSVNDFKIYDENNNDVTELFEIIYKEADLQIYKEKLIIETESIYSDYDGSTEWRNDERGQIKVIGEELLTDYDVKVSFSSLSKTVFQKNNSAILKIYDKNNNDVTDHYLITENFGKAVMRRKPITVRSKSKTVKHEPETGQILEYKELEEIIGLVEGDEIKEVIFTGQQVDLGSSPNTFSIVIYRGNLDVTQYYEIMYIPGELEIR
ncbi:hypothetical protein BN85408320 [Alteracholeplasma palmae J233]|uniref:Transglutaminase-like domain-containing protein n=1 Tax=Alteracholeplasma palmae (strain ATCC 49389 / J233) TaxID=1318466 RepID=U4KKT9_ALTPJ|nr:transglutaminase domain-containing protein [Alteracholeplasma palmae]CCV64409.1 hypothetical protein BN85408320 [Alteracholeplasma palmae J233]